MTWNVGIGCISLPFLLWILLYSSLKGKFYEMDWGSTPGTFLVPYALYRKLYWVIFSLSLVGMALFIHFPYPPIAIIFLFAAVYSLLFQAWTSFCYESYLHHRYPRSLMHVSTEQERQTILRGSRSSYTNSRHAFTLTLAIVALFLFLAGLIVSVPAMIEG